MTDHRVYVICHHGHNAEECRFCEAENAAVELRRLHAEVESLRAKLVAAAAKQPLPEDQLWKAVEDGERAFVAGGPGTSWTLCVARAIEAAHGIGGEE